MVTQMNLIMDNTEASAGGNLPTQYQTAPVALQGQVTGSVPSSGGGDKSSRGAGIGNAFKRRLLRFSKRAYSLGLVASFFALYELSPSFAFAAADKGKVKQLGDTFYENVRSFGLTIAGCGFAILAVIGLVLITFSGIKPEWRKTGGDIIKFGVIGVGGLALLSVFLPILIEIINGLGGDTIEMPSGAGGK